MIRRSIVVAVFTVFLLGGFGAAAQVQETGWKEFQSKEGGFSVLLPGAPVEEKQAVQTELGPIEVRTFTFGLKENVGAYVVSFNDYPVELVKQSDPQKMLDGARDGAVRTVKGRLLSEKKITLDGAPGRELRIEAPGTLVIQSRIYLVKNRLYQILAVTQKEKAADAEITKFRDSFKLVKVAE